MNKYQKVLYKVWLHLAVKYKYRINKIKYACKSKNRHKQYNYVSKRKTQFISNEYKPNVFLNMPLSMIDYYIAENKTFHDRIVKEGELSYGNEWLILNSRHNGLYNQKNSHYRWTEDIFTKYVYNDCFYMDVMKQKTSPNTDIKIPWEIARMQTLFSLGLAYRATKDEKYARRITEIIRDFRECCPREVGVNWCMPMEVAIRISNIILACELIKDSTSFDTSFRCLFVDMVYEHMIHIRNNMEKEKDGNNHLIADLLGLAATSAAIPFLPRSNKISRYVQKMLRRELMRQVHMDGGHFEGSVSYHRLVGEMMCFAIIAQEKLGFCLSEEENERLFKMGDFTSSIRMENGLVPQFGDTDSGRVFQFAPEETRNHDSFINLVSCVTHQSIVYPDRMDGFFVFYSKGISLNPDLYVISKIKHFPLFKLLVYRNDNLFFAFCGMNPELYGKVGHSHNDILSFVLSVGQEEFISDPGSGEYTGNLEIGFSMRSVYAHSALSVDCAEQRIPPIDHRAFVWNSVAETHINYEVLEHDLVCLLGECIYDDSSGKEIKIFRRVSFFPGQIVIEDSIIGMEKECSMSLPIFPQMGVQINGEKAIVNGKQHRLTIGGSYNFSVVHSKFAEQYKRIVQSETIHCQSCSDTNTLCIEWQ